MTRRSSSRASAQPDLAIIDVKMPRLDGIEAARRILDERPIPIVMLTAYGQDELVSRAVEAGVFGYLVKPFREQDLLPAIRRRARPARASCSSCGRKPSRWPTRLPRVRRSSVPKGLLMEKESLSEQDAFARLRKASPGLRSSRSRSSPRPSSQPSATKPTLNQAQRETAICRADGLLRLGPNNGKELFVATAGTGANGRLQVGTSVGHAGVAGRLLAPEGAGRSAGTAALVATAAALTAGLIGVYRYLDNFWLYRGYAAPSRPAWVTRSAERRNDRRHQSAIGGRSQQVIVYLPPGYAAHPRRRYPVFYLLHGSPGLPNALLLTVKTGVVEDELVAKHKIRPMILVMPFGSSGRFTDTEWANGVPGGLRLGDRSWPAMSSGRSMLVIADRSGSAPRARGALRRGYGSLNVGLHHPGEFRVLESWSGYERADKILSIFGRGKKRACLPHSPSSYVSDVASRLRTRRNGRVVLLQPRGSLPEPEQSVRARAARSCASGTDSWSFPAATPGEPGARTFRRRSSPPRKEG